MTDTQSEGKPVLVLGITGGIAAYKAATILKLLRDDVDAHVVMTDAATKFVTPLTFATLTGHPVITDLFEGSASGDPLHIHVTDRAACLCVAPCTASMLGKLAHGIADDALSTVALAVSCPTVLAPAMNARMWSHPITQDNLARLRAFGYQIVAPESGWQACGTVGPGRLPEEERIAEAVRDALAGRFAPPHAPEDSR